MDYIKYSITCAPELAEILIAYLGEGAFDSFQETETGLDAYLPVSTPLPSSPPTGRGASLHDDNSITENETIKLAERIEQSKPQNLKTTSGQASLPPGGGDGGGADTAESLLQQLQQQFPFRWTKEFLPAQNWNEIWESNFQPVIVEDFCAVRADFHAPVPGVEHELVINPKMAFGTGHHETTWMCLRALRSLPCRGAYLLDFGCGTGVLAILAARLGAAEVEAVDIEAESYRNTLENSANNGVAQQITARHGTLDAVRGTAFDGILANINRHIILEALPRLKDLLKPGGWLLVSGILEQDGDLVTQSAAGAGFTLQNREQRGNWLCLRFAC
ncbi:MAG: 50S ribosomal protein L11 methyltransferase [Saprospiraceae bacterium]